MKGGSKMKSKKIKSFRFSPEEVRKIGRRVEKAMSKNIPTKEERHLLEYVKICLLFRKSMGDAPDNPNNPYSVKLFDVAKKIKICPREMQSLSFWARGSLQNINDLYSPQEIEILIKRIEKQLEKPPL